MTMSEDYNVTCDYSGFVCKRSECIVQWNGLLVRKDFAEDRRHPQDKIPTVKESAFRGVVRDEQPDPPNDPLLTVDQII